MTIDSKYDPNSIEDHWYAYWLEHGFFESSPDPDKEPFTILIPPPNVTGVLHMGHILNNTIQDILIRRARMLGKEALWVPGTDHASIATEAKVVAYLKSKGIEKNNISREEFLEHAWQWREKYGGIIIDQLKKLGASCDWSRTFFTMDERLYDSVIHVFVDLFEKGYIYRGMRMINWDPAGKTALADDEVIYKEVQSKLYHIAYPVEGSDESVVIATTRPETILGDTAICVNPADERFQHLQGKNAIIPLIDRVIPIIADDYVSMEFGTGCLKITPAHDPNDYEIGQRHNLESIDILHEDGTLNERAQLFVGEDRFDVRKKIAIKLQEEGYLLKTEDYLNNVGFSERTDAVIEPRISTQWFVKMDEITKPALQHVMDDTIQLIPSKFKNTYRHWMENVHDWCISRQLWWGHQIPAYYLPNGQYVVAHSREEALTKARQLDPAIKPEQLVQDEDVLDTWFSAWLLPVSVFDGILDPDNEEISYYYPTNDLVTAPEILFFWVARMIISGYEYQHEKPFGNVYLTGIVRDKLRRKMSKSLGNSPDPLDLIASYGADGVRTGMLLSSPAGNDLLFDEKLCEQGRNFANKIWNAFRLIMGFEEDGNADKIPDIYQEWIENRINQSLSELEEAFEKYRLSDTIMILYKLIWDDFCSWYLELIKPAYGKPVHPETRSRALDTFEKLMVVLHPFMPFITEEIWQKLRERDTKATIMYEPWPLAEKADQQLTADMSLAFEIITQIRNVRATKNISPKEALVLKIKTADSSAYQEIIPVIKKLGIIETITFSADFQQPGTSFIVNADECFIPLDSVIDLSKEREELARELEYTQGFLQSVSRKLANEKFVKNAPEEVVNKEIKKKEDAEARIKTIEDTLAKLAD